MKGIRITYSSHLHLQESSPEVLARRSVDKVVVVVLSDEFAHLVVPYQGLYAPEVPFALPLAALKWEQQEGPGSGLAHKGAHGG